MNTRRRIASNRLMPFAQGGFMQPQPSSPSVQKLDISQISYDAPNFVSNGATRYDLAKALEREFQDLNITNEVNHPELMAPEMETTVPALTVKSQASDADALARDTVAAVKRELVKSANLFAQFHIMNHEKTGQWPEWYQQRHDAALRQAIFWEREWAERVDPFAGFPPELSGEDKCDLFLGQILAAVGKTDELEALQQEKGWSREEMEGMLAGVGPCGQEKTRNEHDIISFKIINQTTVSANDSLEETVNVGDSLEKNVPVMILAKNDNAIISDASGPDPIKNQGPTTEERAKIMESIEDLKGTPYPPAEGGLDCSHAVHEAYKNAGLNYEYLTSRAFPSKYFIEISEDELQPGDIVHWPGHVSIYKEGTGQGMIVIGARRPGKLLSETPAKYFDGHGSRTYYRLIRQIIQP